MRYCELTTRFDERKVWGFKEGEFLQPMRWADVEASRLRLEELKKILKRDIMKTIEPAIDEAKSEKEIGVNLDPVFDRFSKSFFVSEQTDTDLLLEKANKNTLQKKLQSWCAQLNHNIPTVRKHPGAKVYYNQLKNVPAVIVAAGPSLKNAVDVLARLKNKACVIAVDTSFRSCVRRGIVPDFVNAHDANQAGARFFKDTAADQTVAVFVNYIHPDTIQAYQGPKVFYYVDDPSIPTYQTMAHACDGERPDGSFLDSSIVGGSCVAHTALYLAVKMGCNPITFVGLDLSYPDLERSHFESDNSKKVKGQKLLSVTGINGRQVKTNLSFMSYKVVFDRMAPIISLMNGVKLYTSSQNDDGTMAGIVHQGLEPMPFETWVEKFATTERDELKQKMGIYQKYCPKQDK